MRQFRTLSATIIGSLLFASTAFAHPHHVEHTHGIWEGVTHPLLGLDHLLAMVTVGLLAAQRGGRAMWAVPATFVLSLIAGGAAGILNWPLPAVEFGIAASIVLLGVAVARNRPGRIIAPLLYAAVFGFFHGHAHGQEMPEIATPALYAAGFVVSTIVLHVFGVMIGRLAMRSTGGVKRLRFGGAAVACAGLLFAVLAI